MNLKCDLLKYIVQIILDCLDFFEHLIRFVLLFYFVTIM